MIEKTLGTEIIKTKDFFSFESLFKKESHYFIFSLLLSILTTTILHNTPANEILELARHNKYVNVFTILPATTFPSWIKDIDVDYWEAYYCVQFSIMPAYIALGFIGCFFSLDYQRKKISKETNWKKIIFAEIVLMGILFLYVSTPGINEGYPIRNDYWDQEKTLPTLACTWLFSTLMFYGFGYGLSTPIQIFRLNKVINSRKNNGL